MKTLKPTLILLIVFAFSNPVQAQFWKKLGDKVEKAAERVIVRKVEEKTEEKTGKAMDTILNQDEKLSKKERRRRNKQKKKTESSNQDDVFEEENNTSNRNNVRSKADFEPGNHVLFSETFTNDAIGDFPITWNTNSSGEIVTINNTQTKWFKMGNGEYIPDGVTNFPENATLEFDIILGEEYNWLSNGIAISIANLNNRAKDFVNWRHTGRHQKANDNGISLYFNPISGSPRGGTTYASYANGKKVLTNNKAIDEFSGDSRNVHIALWRQKTRLRVYIDDVKIWDLPRIFSEGELNSLIFSVDGSSEKDVFYVSNVRLAKAGEDKRHALLETGTFTTNAILFESGSDNLKKMSNTIIQEIATVLQKNPSIRIQIIGHTDADGADESNLTLSEKRALAVKNVMQYKYDIEASRIETSGKGEAQPVGNNTTAEGKAQNRRVEFIVIKK